MNSNLIKSAIFSLIVFSGILISFSFIQDASATEYDYVDGIKNEITFHFRDGMETVNFPVFSTTSDLVSDGATSFEVKGVIGNNPHLHMALDEAFKHRMSTLTAGSSFEFDYRFFDVDVNVVQNETILKSFEYKKCEISNYGISTLTDDYESYLAPNTGFAIVNNIEFQCGRVHLVLASNISSSYDYQFIDYGSLQFALAEDARTFLTFEFDNGAEKIESVIFTLTSGFSESNDAGPSFQIITAVLPHPLIDNAIIKSEKVQVMASTFNHDFDVSVEFVNSVQKIRGLNFDGCIISGYDF